MIQIDRRPYDRLSSLVKLLIQQDILSRQAFAVWKKKQVPLLSNIFQYEQKNGMPSIDQLISLDFHPELPLILLNYSTVAHNTLHEYPEGWTPVLRACRGLVIDFDGYVVGLPFLKFFNYLEHAETKLLPNLKFTATKKHDGHLGIIFQYRGQMVLTTRGRFASPSSKLGNEMLKTCINQYWNVNPSLCLLVEMIHPDTQVLTNYFGKVKFVLIGATDAESFVDYGDDYETLTKIAIAFDIELTEQWDGYNLKDLITWMKDRSVDNQEGYVITFSNGLRVKVKFETYIGKMVAAKLSYNYLMRRLLSGNTKKMLLTLPEEIHDTAMRMLGEILILLSTPGEPKDRWRALYTLEGDNASNTFKNTCREFVKTFNH